MVTENSETDISRDTNFESFKISSWKIMVQIVQIGPKWSQTELSGSKVSQKVLVLRPQEGKSCKTTDKEIIKKLFKYEVK